MNIKNEFKLEIGAHYSESDIMKMDVKSLNNRSMDYLVYEKDSQAYFFEKVDKAYRLFDITSRLSFYLV